MSAQDKLRNFKSIAGAGHAGIVFFVVLKPVLGRLEVALGPSYGPSWGRLGDPKIRLSVGPKKKIASRNLIRGNAKEIF